MGSRSYQNFDLLIEADGPGAYHARVTTCPLGESPDGRFSLPFDATQLENLMLKLDPGRSGTRRAAADPQTQATMDLGGPLFETVFSEDIMLAWSRSQDVARQSGDGLRLRLRLTDAPAIAGLPWELLYDRRSNSFIAQSERTPLVRYLEIPQPPRPLVVDGPLKILAVISSPTDLPELNVEAEWSKVHEALGAKIEEGTVQLDRLPAPTMSALSTWLRHHDVHILHFIGHGDYDERLQDGVLFFCDRFGRSVQVTPSVLGPHLRDHDPLRLVLLNACQSARVDTTDPYSGMAQGLVQQDATAVVAMQFPISDDAAVAFTGEFYGALADGLPVDQAATSARKALLADFAAEWATPVLFLRAPDGQVFDKITAVIPSVVTPLLPEPEPGAGPTPAPAPEPVLVPELTLGRPLEGRTTPDTEPIPTVQPTPHPVAFRAPDPPVQPQSTYEPPQPRTTYEPPQPQTYYPPPQPQSHQAPPPTTGWPPQTRQGPAPKKPNMAKRVVLWVGAAVVALLVLGTIGAVYDEMTKQKVVDDPGGSGSIVDSINVTAAFMSTPPTLDGDPTEWLSSTAYRSSTLVAPDGASPTVSGVWALGWDATHLYLYVDVTDPQLTQTHATEVSQLWQGDSVSFELGTAHPTHGDQSLEPGDLHVLIGPVADGTLLGGLNVAKGTTFVPGGTIPGGQGATRLTDHGYAVEAAIPWATLRIPSPAAGLTLGTNLNVSDANPSGDLEGGFADMVSNNPDRHGNDAAFRSTWGTLELKG